MRDSSHSRNLSVCLLSLPLFVYVGGDRCGTEWKTPEGGMRMSLTPVSSRHRTDGTVKDVEGRPQTEKGPSGYMSTGHTKNLSTGTDIHYLHTLSPSLLRLCCSFTSKNLSLLYCLRAVDSSHRTPTSVTLCPHLFGSKDNLYVHYLNSPRLPGFCRV